MGFLKMLFRNENIRNGSIFTLFAFLNNGISFLLLLLLSWYISPNSYGQLNLFYTSVSVLSVLISLNTGGIIGIEFYKTSKNNLAKYINVVIYISILIFIFLLLFIFIFHKFIYTLSNISLEFQIVSVFIVFSQVFYNMFMDIYRLEEKPVTFGFVSTIFAVLNLGLTLLLVIHFKLDWESRVYSQLIIVISFAIYSIFLLHKKKYINFVLPRKLHFRNSISFGVPLIPHSLSAWLKQGLDRYIINHFFQATSVGLFSFAFNFSTIIIVFGNAFNQSNSVFVFKKLSEDIDASRSVLKKQAILMTVFFIVLTVIVFVGSSLLIPLLVPKYIDAIKYIFPLTMAAFFNCIYFLFCNYLFYFQKTKELMYITLSVAILHLLLSLLITRYSVILTAYLSLFTGFLETLLVFLYSRKVYKII